MKKIITLILLSLNLMCMAQTKQPEVLFEKKNINVFLEKDEDSSTYLTQVTVYAPANLSVFWGSEMEEKEFQERNIEFSIVYHCSVESKKSLRGIVSVAYFAKDTTNYKIYGTGFLEKWSWRESENHPLKPMSFEAKKGVCTYIGNSDNKELLAVKVWEYIKNSK